MARLDDATIASLLQEIPGWERQGDALVRTYVFKNFREAMAFVNRVAELAEEARHHPDITIRYNRVQLLLTTHEAGGITERDIALARKLAELAS
ncbi:4a-hydroxytetrahydrobiopterin dehydratase [Thermomicrobium sp.]|jgi:4a-hydroxytetrahydrobiopterin dehydratase|uniref:4a-hydroxytetrahydrobiopterin dehydratase n=1 Tax=Thermomicrobium sp. TaxID=1969469 RepID=UPI001B23A6F2|nr:4a-hydroxytetrahydrobiopterin dehydratase [Thermomicrobium sp.]MBO9307267.1 4a-hydroxytetrahydrobiopterin dehydratase [Thermomicrobium sp.]MBO9350620.1 4a-hydroxytetrahydrobiopterin dehydratase [Thermomicrobium sp.]MBO9359201.1 4a-hydroxytetrahydrobiopterin dehydratase [Thermomicrobium sp.]MBO9385242.1 4a-hydroxytetrahydrobiopterin dehydratase [Thermomicrobium sp.]MBO9404674.1 4a-hydroxytetrahydrobiopterin dehydratase [Thermomicrobium sp.]